MEQAARASGAMMQIFMMGTGMLSKGFYEKYGKEALPIITDVMSRGGEESGKLMQQMLPAKDMNAIAESFKMMEPMMGVKMEVVESSDDMVHFKISPCPLGLEGTSRELCEAVMTTDNKMVCTALEREVETKILKTVAAGDKECEIIHSFK